ncbi:hypothetical protein NDU88_007270 [Pleurodeles waltl]|uniref:Uncharacterized protein n=1 Tax=Pleurodeles waltl TaxID=8319 RepID=A0AAV7USE7_PLEWA|nr:hypothetical protein NDU88_007270 [Pleurodeles waltl]
MVKPKHPKLGTHMDGDIPPPACHLDTQTTTLLQVLRDGTPEEESRGCRGLVRPHPGWRGWSSGNKRGGERELRQGADHLGLHLDLLPLLGWGRIGPPCQVCPDQGPQDRVPCALGPRLGAHACGRLHAPYAAIDSARLAGPGRTGLNWRPGWVGHATARRNQSTVVALY